MNKYMTPFGWHVLNISDNGIVNIILLIISLIVNIFVSIIIIIIGVFVAIVLQIPDMPPV